MRVFEFGLSAKRANVQLEHAANIGGLTLSGLTLCRRLGLGKRHPGGLDEG